MNLPNEPGPAGAGFHLLLIDPTVHDARSPGPTRGYDFAARCCAAGHRITILTAGTGSGAATPEEGLQEGLTVRAQPTVRGAGWDLPVSGRARFMRWALREMWRVNDADAVIVVTEPWTLLGFAAFYAWIRAIPLIADVRAMPPADPRPTAPVSVRFSATVQRLGRRMALALARRAIVASPAIASAMTSLGLADAKRLQLPMGCDPTLLSLAAGADNAVLRETPDLGRRPLVVWAGAFTADRPLARMLDLAAALQENILQVTLVMCGDGPQRAELIRLIHERGVSENALTILGPLPRAQMAGLLAAATVVLALPSANDTASDVFDGLAAGKPVVYLGDSWQRTLLESRGAGFGVPMDDPSGAAREIADIMRDPDGLRRAGQQAAALAAGRYNLDRLMAETRQAIEALVAAAPRAEILRRRTLFWKRVGDVAVAGVALVILSPVAVALAVLIGIKLGGPVIVTHDRAGLKGRPFRLLKFRTLTDAEDPSGALLPENQRLTALGRFLRRTALDEIPTLINVVAGDMSLVGPRPLPVSYTPYYTPAQRRRLEMRPGLTGLAQIERTSAKSWDEKFARDVVYIDRVSLGLDLKILFKTVFILLRDRDIDRTAAMPRFDEMMAHREGAEDA
jgi:lipopolysaccharide/colanic/teichoic acid biosynthesis glycosyltransferase/glycosyltransferase involved in cell wall biosynthesis